MWNGHFQNENTYRCDGCSKCLTPIEASTRTLIDRYLSGVILCQSSNAFSGRTIEILRPDAPVEFYTRSSLDIIGVINLPETMESRTLFIVVSPKTIMIRNT